MVLSEFNLNGTKYTLEFVQKYNFSFNSPEEMDFRVPNNAAEVQTFEPNYPHSCLGFGVCMYTDMCAAVCVRKYRHVFRHTHKTLVKTLV